MVLSYGAESDQALGIPGEVSVLNAVALLSFPFFIISVLGNRYY